MSETHTRRSFLKTSLALSAYSLVTATGLVIPIVTHANGFVDFFAPSTLDETLKKTFNSAQISDTDKIELKLPSIAENGAVVPITVSSSLELVQQIFILVNKNPVPLAALFDLSPEIEPFVSARLKIAETSDVIVVVKSAEHLYKTQQTVKVTMGGCGG